MRHVIEMLDSAGRDFWECSCGRSGSTQTGDGDRAAERHVPAGDQVSYRYPASGRSRAGELL